MDDADRSAAVHLAGYLHDGGALEPLSSDFGVRSGEAVHALLPVSLEEYLAGGDGMYVKKTGVPVSALGAAMRVGMAVGNSHRKHKAARAARQQWRCTGTGRLYVTNWRLAMQLAQTWDVIDYRALMQLGLDDHAIYVEMNGRPTVRLVVPAPAYHYVMLYYLVFGEAVLPPDGV